MNIRRRNLSVLLSIVGGVGTIATALLARKAAAVELKMGLTTVEEGDDGGGWIKNLTKKDILKVYAPTIAVGSATIASIAGSTLLSRKTEASLIGMAMMADQGWRKYKHQVKRYLGGEEHVNVLKGLARDKKIVPEDTPEYRDDGRKLYFEEHIGFFLADPEKLSYAYGDLNQRLHVMDPGVSAGYAMLYDLVDLSDAEVLDENIKPEDLQWGWSYDYLFEVDDYAWVHWFFHDDATPDGTPYTVIEWGEEPILNPGNYGEYWIGKDYHESEQEAFSPVSKSLDKKRG